ncbi:MAG: hypothetical protein HUJ26_05665 [Planctomycetaceae bacterium]|nr:hypothetical protein [Planctomycetaceae bacterium]
MIDTFFHPALRQLIRIRTYAKLRRMVRSSFTPRRAFLTMLVIFLGLFWMITAGASMLNRQTFDPENFRRSISLFLALYFLWHLVRLAWKRPEPMEDWTAAEQFHLLSGPFSGRHLIGYRLAVIFSATLFKASLVTFLMLPDLPNPILGFSGFLFGLIFLEFLRLNAETIINGLPQKVYQGYRLVVCGILLLFFSLVLLRLFHLTEEHLTDLRDLRNLIPLFKSELEQLRATFAGRVIEYPFSSFAALITTNSFSTLAAGRFLLCGGLVVASGYAVIHLDLHNRQLELKRERARKDDQSAVSFSDESNEPLLQLKKLPRFGGIVPLAWRQTLCARRYVGGLLISLIIPAILSLFPLAVPNDPIPTFVSVITGTLFFSFMLLPATIKYDFRRDFDRLSALKMLPVPPRSMVLGQLTVPVIATFGFQLFVLTVSMLVRPIPVNWYLSSLLILFPIVVFLVALDNLIFLWYPHRLVEEGFEVFLRSILTFTSKILLCGLGIGLILWCDFLSRIIADRIDIPQRTLFVAGLILLGWSFAGVCLGLVIHAFKRFDPSVEQSR